MFPTASDLTSDGGADSAVTSPEVSRNVSDTVAGAVLIGVLLVCRRWPFPCSSRCFPPLAWGMKQWNSGRGCRWTSDPPALTVKPVLAMGCQLPL